MRGREKPPPITVAEIRAVVDHIRREERPFKRDTYLALTQPVPPKKGGGRAPKGRGYRSEKRAESVLIDLGFKRVWGSGAHGHVADELRSDLRYVRSELRCVQRIEVKRRKGGQTFVRRALAQDDAQALILDPGGMLEGMLVAMPIGVFRALLTEAGY